MREGLSFLQKEYSGSIVSLLMKKYKINNIHLAPKIVKVVVSMRLGKDSTDKKAIEGAMNDLMLISGQKPAYSKAKKSIAGFKVREGQTIGTFVTLRKKMMYEFLERLIYVALPRIRDFKGYKSESLDSMFNLNFGIKEHLVFKELSYDKVYKARGLDVSINLANVSSVDMAVDFLRCFKFPIK